MTKNKRKLIFTKMHGLENDFMIVNTLTQKFFFTKKIIQFFSNRYTGIGFDQLLLVEKPVFKNTNFHYRIFNANGSEVEQCGNGARCFAKFIFDQKLLNSKIIKVSTKNRIIKLKVINSDNILVNMGSPEFHPKKIPFLELFEKDIYSLSMNKEIIFFGVVSLGNPHCVVIVDDINKARVNEIGSYLESHVSFPNQVNVGFMQIINKNHIFLRVFERGVGETRSCGSGACAAVAIGIRQKKLLNKVRVDLAGGKMLVKFDVKKNCLYMIGPAKKIYDGIIYY
ncbi:diaminopimelate epimerase [Buchnera aphidicola]|uniref:diaminopimelate epimerase n=1 Tax=Buchnera aphidicola TaxID=9 RepID=UPI0020936BBB|nr:diaminopimelate epimerase [Buchnera aphidicola]USS94123.1 diaminopimelate epimerase [Buchnera aphidicola (Sipha maydis)]